RRKIDQSERFGVGDGRAVETLWIILPRAETFPHFLEWAGVRADEFFLERVLGEMDGEERKLLARDLQASPDAIRFDRVRRMRRDANVEPCALVRLVDRQRKEFFKARRR